MNTVKTPQPHPQLLALYDNAGITLDRYTAVFLQDKQPGRCASNEPLYGAFAMCESPFSPMGFGQHTTAQVGDHLGAKITFADLPPDCKSAVIQDLLEHMETASDETILLFAAASVGVSPSEVDGGKWNPLEQTEQAKALCDQLEFPNDLSPREVVLRAAVLGATN